MKRNRTENKVKLNLNIKSLRFYILSGICGALAIMSIFMTIESATNGAEVADLQKQEAQQLARQQDLQSALVQNLSVSALEERSGGLGFTKISNLVYVADSIPVARLPQ